MVDAVNTAVSTSEGVLAQIGNEGDDPDTVESVVTVAQLETIIPEITGLVAGNEGEYQDYIDANPNSFSDPATQAEVQTMVNVVNTSSNILAEIGIDADNGSSDVSIAELNSIVPVLNGVITANSTKYQEYIANNPGAFSSPATQPEVQAMIDAVNASQGVLAQIGGEADDPDSVESVVTTEQLESIVPELSGIEPGNEEAYQEYIDTNPNSFSDPATQAEVQTMIDSVNEAQNLLVEIGIDEDDGTATSTNATATELNNIVGVTGAISSNEGYYQDFIDQNGSNFSSPATAIEVQVMIDTVNTSQSILTQIGNEGDDPDAIASVITVAQLGTINPEILGLVPGNESGYQEYIDENPNSFSEPATLAEVQAMVTAVNISEGILTQIGNEGDDPNEVESLVTVSQLNTIIGLSGTDPANETLYRQFIDSNPEVFSAPATIEEVQNMIDEVNTVAIIVGFSDDPADGNPSATTLTQIGMVNIDPVFIDEYEEAISNADPAPNSLEELQMIVDAVNAVENGINEALAEILEDSNSENGENNSNGTSVTVEQLAQIPGLTGINPENEDAYQLAISAETGFSNPPKIEEIQEVIDNANTLIELIEGANSPAEGNPSISDLIGLGIIDVDSERGDLYEEAIANANPKPRSLEELQAIIDRVNNIPLKVTSAQAFTPNGDGINEAWTIDGILDYPNNQIRVFNRSGREVFAAREYQNDWEGFYKTNNEKLPAGSYYYVIDLGDGSAPIDGWIFINY
jgi:gliding motility-associated-like protein